LLGIASLGYPNNGGLYIGYGDKNKDEIWRVYWDGDEDGDRYVKVCDNVFEFIKGLIQIKQEEFDKLWTSYFG
jgi:hypothetical protein